MKRSIGLVFVLLVSCGSPEKAVEREAIEESRSEEAADDLLRIAPDMLRDLKVTTLVVEAHRGAEEASMLGELRVDANRHAQVSTPIPAQIAALRAATGERVSQGTVLVELRSVELGRARAEHMSAEARVALARQTLDRKKTLSSERIAAGREVEEAEANLKAAEAELRAAAASLTSLGAAPEPAGEDPSRFELRSPIAGVVLERTAVRRPAGRPLPASLRDCRARDLVARGASLRARCGAGSRGRSRSCDLSRASRENVRGTGRSGRSSGRRGFSNRADPSYASEPRGPLPARHVGNRRDRSRGRRSFHRGGARGLVAETRGRLGGVPPARRGSFRDPRGRSRPGPRGEVEIVSGLSRGETVVVEGAFLLKAEADKARGAGEAHEH